MLQSSLARKVHFSAAHRYTNPDWSDARNKEVFGSCFSEHGHGHNYVLEATISGPVNSETGMIINLSDLDRLLKEVITPLDHRFLNIDVPYFQTKLPTTETIALYCFEGLKEKLALQPRLCLDKVRLYENEDLWAEVTE